MRRIAIAGLIALLLASPATAAVTRESVQSVAGSATLAMTVTSSSTVVACIADGGGATVSSVVWNGAQNLTFIGRASNADGLVMETWYLNAPATGAHNLVATLTSGTPSVVVSYGLLGAHATAPVVAHLEDTYPSSSSSVSDAVSSSSSGYVIDCFSVRNLITGGPTVSGVGQVSSIATVDDGTWMYQASAVASPGASSNTSGWTWSGGSTPFNHWVHTIVSLQAPAAVITQTGSRMLTLGTGSVQGGGGGGGGGVVGNTYYVSGSGSNANSCTTAKSATVGNAKLTLAGALACVTAANGDSILFHVGTYTGLVNMIDNVRVGATIPAGTSFANALTIGSAGDGTVTLQSTTGTSPLSLDGNTVKYIIVQDLTLDANSSPEDAVYLADSSHIRVQRNIIENARVFGVHTGDTGVTHYSDDLQILNNTITTIGTHNLSPGTNGHGIYLSSSTSLIEGNDISNCEGYGVHIFNNPPATAANDANNIVRKNKIHNFGLTAETSYGITIDRAQDNLVYNNIVYNAITVGGGNGGIQCYAASLNCQVYNNTVYNVNGECVALQYYDSAPIIQNNICSSTGSAVVDYAGGTGTPTTDHNINNLNSAQFTNAAGADFTLLGTATTAIDQGVSKASIFTTDYAGTARPQSSAWDIGAYER